MYALHLFEAYNHASVKIPPKAPPAYKPSAPAITAPPAYKPQQANNRGVQLKPANHFKVETRPAPPVYRPQQAVNPSVQPKAAKSFEVKARPTSPVYQNREQGTRHSEPSARSTHGTPGPAAGNSPRRAFGRGQEKPPVYRPNQVNDPSAQLKPANNFRWEMRAAPPVYRPQQGGSPGLQSKPANNFRPRDPQAPLARNQSFTIQRSEIEMVSFSSDLQEVPKIKKPNVPDNYDEDIWNKLTDVSLTYKKSFFGAAIDKSPEQLVPELFQKFVNYGFGYDLRNDFAVYLLHKTYTRELPDDQRSPNGNCIAYAGAFAEILNSFGIAAEVKQVRKVSQGRFLVRVARFIDKTVGGNIYVKGTLRSGYYVFKNHSATWVPDLNKYFDPMATISYESLEPYIECDLNSNQSETVFIPKSKPKSLETSYDWKLVATEEAVPGGFYRLDLVPNTD